ncbi:MAG: GNAT family N-acetyltransferase [Planctomycetota bacterium]|jgi:CelD/BcsL family acetyltransferase involved in cellulose biosynthesis
MVSTVQTRSEFTPAPALPLEPAPPLRLVDAPLTCEVSPTFWEIEGLRDEWDAIIEATGAPIEMTYDWCRVWWMNYGDGREGRIYIFRGEGDLVGVVPVCIDRVGPGPIGLRVARIMGADSTPGLCDLPVLEPWAEMVIDDLLERLIGDEGCDAVLMGPLSDAGGRADAIRAAAGRRADLVTILRDRVVTRHTTIALPRRFDDYVASLSRNLRHNVRKAWRRLNADYEVDVETVVDPCQVHTELEAFIDMHIAQWQAQNKLGHFGNWPRAWAFHHDLVAAMSAQDRVRLLRLSVGGTVIARQYAFVFADTCSCRLSARDAGREWDTFGPGLLSLLTLFEEAIDEGMRTVDAGTGDYGYKRRLGGAEHDARSILLVANRASARRRARLACLWADWLDRLYYKLWFCELAPRLKLLRRPLWRTWIRTRL